MAERMLNMQATQSVERERLEDSVIYSEEKQFGYGMFKLKRQDESM